MGTGIGTTILESDFRYILRNVSISMAYRFIYQCKLYAIYTYIITFEMKKKSLMLRKII